MKHIQREWLEFRDKLIPMGADGVQLQEMKKAFFAGAFVMRQVLEKVGNLPQKEAFKVFGELDAEFNEVIRTSKEGKPI